MQFVFYNTFSQKENFDLTHGKRPWNVLFVLKDGKFCFSFDDDRIEFIAQKNQIVYFPLNQSFSRRVLEPIGFHQLGVLFDDKTEGKGLKRGVLNIPEKQVEAIISGLDKIQDTDDINLLLHYAGHIAVENFVFSQPENASPIKNVEDINFAVRYMQAHLSEKFSIEDIAKTVHLSHVGLIWKFKQRLGFTPSEFLLRLRLQKAKHLLLETDLTVSRIAEQCGFATPYYFSRRFKEFLNLTPTEFRRKAMQYK